MQSQVTDNSHSSPQQKTQHLFNATT